MDDADRRPTTPAAETQPLTPVQRNPQLARSTQPTPAHHPGPLERRLGATPPLTNPTPTRRAELPLPRYTSPERPLPDSTTPHAPARSAQRPRGRNLQGRRLTLSERTEAQRAFLAHYATCANIRAACLAARVSRETVTYWRRNDQLFMDAYQQADEDACDVIRKEIHRRAVEGVTHERPIFQRGILVGVEVITRYSDSLLELEAKRRMKDYRDVQRHELTGPQGAPLIIEIVPGIPLSQRSVVNVNGHGATPNPLPAHVPALPSPAHVQHDPAVDVGAGPDADGLQELDDPNHPANEQLAQDDGHPETTTTTAAPAPPPSEAHLTPTHPLPLARTAIDPDPPAEETP